MNNEDQCYTFAGLTIRHVDTPPFIARAIQSAFPLCKTGPEKDCVTVKGAALEDDAFYDGMPPFLRKVYDLAPYSDDPIIVSGSKDETGIVSKGEVVSTFVHGKAPFSEFFLYCQRFSDRKSPILLNMVLLAMIRELFLLRGKVLLHASCVVNSDGRGVIFPADSGGGKTTTALSMTREGFNLLADDLIVLSLDGDDVIAEGITEPINLTRKTASFFPELARYEKSFEQPRVIKIPVHPDELMGSGRLAGRAMVKAIVSVEIGGANPCLAPVPAAALLSQILKGNTFATGANISSRSLDVIWPLLERSELLRLVTGPDPVAMGKFLAERFNGEGGPKVGAGPFSVR